MGNVVNHPALRDGAQRVCGGLEIAADMIRRAAGRYSVLAADAEVEERLARAIALVDEAVAIIAQTNRSRAAR